MPKILDKSISSDIQGIILYGYGHMSAASYLMLHMKDNRRADVKKWLGLAADQLTHAGGKNEGTSMNLALTSEGLKAIGMPDSVMTTFPRPFQEGMKMEHKSVGFGDIGENAPEHWEWGNEDKAHEIHILLMLYAENDQMLEKYEQEQ
ncbi:MAG: deferrochelatase/peroxidase EfeB, partial [Flammeovirgaceae bacterium]